MAVHFAAEVEEDQIPDRLDAMVWALTALFPAISREARAPREPPKVIMAYQGHTAKNQRR